MPKRFSSSADTDAMVERVAPAILALLADDVPRGRRTIAAALAYRHPKDEVARTLMRLAITGRVVEIDRKYVLAMTAGRLVVLTGASGSGKTTIAEAVASRQPAIAEVLCFDRIGAPPEAEMVAGWGSAKAWQRAMTLEWMVRLVPVLTLGRPVLFEGFPSVMEVEILIRIAIVYAQGILCVKVSYSRL